MNNMPLVTVTMPCYNHEKFVREAVESVLNQTYPNIELVIIENGSTDGCRDILREYEDRATIIYFDKNDLPRAVETFFSAQYAKGKYQANMTSDDVWMPDKIEKQVAFMEAHPEYDACFAWGEYGDEQLRLIQDANTELFRQDNKSRDEWIRYFWYEGNCLCAPSSLLRMDVAIALYKERSREMPFYQLFDWYQWMLYLMAGKKFYIYPEILVRMRKHDQAITYSGGGVVRAINEQATICCIVLEQLTDEQFIASFSKDFVKKEARTSEELMCEKILLMFRRAEIQDSMQPIAIDFFYRHYGAIEKVMAEEYGLDRIAFQDICGRMGIGAIKGSYLREIRAEYEKVLLNYKGWRSGYFTRETKEILKVFIEGFCEVVSLLECEQHMDESKWANIINTVQDINEMLEECREALAPFFKAYTESAWGEYQTVISQADYGEKGKIIRYLHKAMNCLETIYNLDA